MPVSGSRGGRAGGAHAAAQDVGADDEIAVGVDALARPDHDVPPSGLGIVSGVVSGHVGIAGQGVGDQHGVAAIGIQVSAGLEGQGHRSEGRAIFQWKPQGRLGKAEESLLDPADGDATRYRG